jgi:hypothetical protein
VQTPPRLKFLFTGASADAPGAVLKHIRCAIKVWTPQVGSYRVFVNHFIIFGGSSLNNLAFRSNAVMIGNSGAVMALKAVENRILS